MRTIWIGLLAGALALAAAGAGSALSIESSPVKVTHRNSGPRYDIDETDRNRPAGAQTAPDADAGRQQAPGQDEPEAGAPVGHVAIRRILLFPMMRPADWHQPEPDQAPVAARAPEPEAEQMSPGVFAKPFWPFMTPARPVRPHLFGADDASRPPRGPSDQDSAASGAEREAERPPHSQPMFDPIQMMMDMMHQALSGHLAPGYAPDLNKDKDAKEAGADNAPAESSDERPRAPGFELTSVRAPSKPAGQNESREDVVEIEGKKYLRKTLINRHVGENMIFMTKRLIFVPLNETDSTTTETVATTTDTDATDAPAPTPVGDHRVGASKPAATEEVQAGGSSTTTTTAAPTTAAPTTAEATTAEATSAGTSQAPSGEQTVTTTAAATSEAAPESSTTGKPSWADRVSDAIDKAAKQLAEETGSPGRTTMMSITTPSPSEKPQSV